MSNFGILLSNPLKMLKVVAICYAICSAAFLSIFVVTFAKNGLSSNPNDWMNMAQLLGALIGPPLALWSIALVLNSIDLQREQVGEQQRQFQEALERENSRLDPVIQGAVLAAEPMWEHGTLGGKTFHLTVKGDAAWLASTIPGGSNPAAITNPDGTVEVILWKAQPLSRNYRGFVEYQRSNGTRAWYRISTVVHDPEPGSKVSFAVSRVSAPIPAEDEIGIEIIDGHGNG